MKKIYLIFVIALAMALVSGCGGSGGGSKSASPVKKVILTDAGWDSIRIHNSIVAFVADKAYGMKTEITAGSTPITHTALVRGDIDVNLETWTDNLATYKEDVKSGAIVELGVNFADNRQGIYVPRYVIEGDAKRGIAAVAPNLKTVADLKNYAGIFKDEETPSKGRIYGAIPGWAADAILSAKYNYLGLNENFVYFRSGSDATLYAAFVSAIEKGQPIAGYLWEPTWITGKYDLVLLDDAPYTNDADFIAGKTAFPSVRVTVCASKKFAASAPEFVEFLKKYATSSAFTADGLAYMETNKANYDATAIYLMKKYDKMLDQWLAADKAKLVRDALPK